MDTKRYAYLAVFGVMSVFIMWGCSGYAKLDLQSEGVDKVTIHELKENWHDFTIHYISKGGSHYGNVAIIFDPKGDDKTMVADRWTRIEDQETLSRIITRIQEKGYHSGIYRILGPDDQFFGYLFAARRQLIAKVVDEKTMQVYDFPPKPSGP